MIAHQMALQQKDLRYFFNDFIYDEAIDDIEFELIKLRDFTDIVKEEFELQ